MEYLRKTLDVMAYRLFVAGRDLKRKVNNGEDHNLVICPFTLTTVAALLYYASEGTAAHRQLEAVLHFLDLFDGRSEKRAVLMAFREAIAVLTKHGKSGPENALFPEEALFAREFSLHFANKLFVQKGADLHDEFLDSMQKNLKIEVEILELNSDSENSKREIERWLAEKVQNRLSASIPNDLIDPVFKGPRAVLGSIAFFRGGWDVPFSRDQSSRGTFNLDNGKTKEVEYMTIKSSFPFSLDEKVGVKMIELPYFHNGASLVITVPLKRTTTLHQMLSKFPANIFQELHMKRRMKTIEVTIPKFHIETTYDVRSLFGQLGVKEVFHDESELPHFTPERVFRLSEGLHKCAIQVDEDGTFATETFVPQEHRPKSRSSESGESTQGSPAPKKSANKTSAPANPTGPPIEEFKADGSFLVAVRHNRSSLFIFSGCVLSP